MSPHKSYKDSSANLDSLRKMSNQEFLDDQWEKAACDLDTVLQEPNINIRPEKYIETDERFLVCDNIIEKEKDTEEEVEPKKTIKTGSSTTFKQYGQGIQNLLNYMTEHYLIFFPLFK